jgi:RHH-type proline utilization regulon transcriptional repressor/proline dehydrogenase/delta 1-pyrroline-5-carboxylate dehydrogenase
LSHDFVNEPQSDFSKATTRAAMQAAIEKVCAQAGRRWESPHRELRLTGPLRESRNPARPDQVVALMQNASGEDVERAVLLATSSAAEWQRRPAAERIATVRRAAALMRERRYELAAWEIIEVGKPWREADADVAEAIDFLEFYAGQMDRVASPLQLGHYPGERNHRVYGPRGVAAVIAPWNFPFAIPAGVPSGVLVCLPGGPEIGRALAASPHVSTIAFTGSKEVGLQLLAGATVIQPGQRLVKRVIAEMGGKNAIIVDETADLDEAIAGVVTSFTGYAGQKCSACSRAIVLESMYDQFLSRLRDAVMSLTVGDPLDPGTQVGPVIDARAKERIDGYIALGGEEGRLLVRRSFEGPGHFVGPAVFADVTSRHRLAQEEIFGPVLAVMKAATVTDALEIANSTSYALTGGIYSRSPANLVLVREQFDVGNLYVNRPITGALVGRQPFGGHRLSGVGAKAGGDEYLTQFMIARVVSENTLRRGFEATD